MANGKMDKIARKGLAKKNNGYWRFQKGNHVTWFDGHKKGTGVIKEIIFDSNSVYKWNPEYFIILDDESGERLRILGRNVSKNE